MLNQIFKVTSIYDGLLTILKTYVSRSHFPLGQIDGLAAPGALIGPAALPKCGAISTAVRGRAIEVEAIHTVSQRGNVRFGCQRHITEKKKTLIKFEAVAYI